MGVDAAVRARAVARYRSGETAAAIATALGVSAKSVYNWTAFASEPRRREVSRHPAKWEALRRYRTENDPLWKIAADLRVSEASIRNWAREEGIPRKPRTLPQRRTAPRLPGGRPTGVSADDWDRAMRLYARGMSASDVIATLELPISVPTLYKWASLCGVSKTQPVGHVSPASLDADVQEKLLERRAAGELIRDLAREFGMNHKTLASWLRRNA